MCFFPFISRSQNQIYDRTNVRMMKIRAHFFSLTLPLLLLLYITIYEFLFENGRRIRHDFFSTGFYGIHFVLASVYIPIFTHVPTCWGFILVLV